MGISRIYIRSELDKLTGAEMPEADKTVHAEAKEYSAFANISFSSQEAEELLCKSSGGFRNRLIRFAFAHKERFKRLPLIGKILVKKKDALLARSLRTRTGEIDLSDCIGWYHDDFLPECYLRLLNRLPDPSGTETARRMFNAGAGNEAIAYAVASSPEFGGRAAVARLTDYKRAYKHFRRKQRLLRIPILGKIAAVFTLPGKHMQLLGRIERNEALIGARMDAASAAIARDHSALSAMIDRMTEMQKTLSAEVLGKLDAQETIARMLSEKLDGQNAQIKTLSAMIDRMTEMQKTLSAEVLGKLDAQETIARTLSEKLDAQETIARTLSEKLDGQAVISTSISEKLDQLPALMKQISVSGRTAVAGIPGGVTGVLAEGFILGVPSEEWGLAMYLSQGGHFEYGCENFFESLLKPGMTVLDLGANVGIYTLRALRAGCRVFSFEPTPRTKQILQQNIKVNGFAESGRAHVIEAAVSNICGSATFYEKLGVCGQNTLYQEENETGIAVTVKTITLDSLRERLGRIDVIKMDIEGAEYNALLGMQELLRENESVQIIMEFAPVHIKRAGHEPSELLQLIKRLGFGIFAVDETRAETRPASDEELLMLNDALTVNLYLKRSGV